MGKFKTAEAFAKDMVKVFKENVTIVSVRADTDVGDPGADTNAYVTDEGLSKLADLFNTVPISLRAAVFSIFLDLLEREKIGYSIEQFGGTVH